MYLDFPTPLSPMIKIFSVVRTSLSILRVKAGYLQQLLRSSAIDFLLNSTEISAKFVHFVIVIFLLSFFSSLNLGERPLTAEQLVRRRASWDGGIPPYPQSPLKAQDATRPTLLLETVLHDTLSFPQLQSVTSLHNT